MTSDKIFFFDIVFHSPTYSQSDQFFQSSGLEIKYNSDLGPLLLI